MPIEALNDNIYSYKSDIWAIGVIFYEMLTGKTPWRAKTESDLKRQLKSTPIKNILPSKIGKESSEFLIRTLTIDVENRMTPQDLCSFFEKNNNSQLDLKVEPRKLVSGTNRIVNNLKSRGISQEKSTRTNDELTSNNISGPRTYKKLNILKGVAEETSY